MSDEKNLEDAIKEILLEAQVPLTRDAITAVMALRHSIEIDQTLVKGVLEGKMDAEFIGQNPDDVMDSAKYKFSKRKGTVPA